MIDMHADLLPRDVDVIEVGVRGSTNPYSAKAAERTRSVIFDAHQPDVGSSAAEIRHRVLLITSATDGVTQVSQLLKELGEPG